MEQDRWSRVKGRLRTSVGEDVYTSWFARMDLEGVQDGKRPSVGSDPLSQELDPGALRRPRSHLLAGRDAEVHRVDLTVRTAMRSAAPAKERPRRPITRRAERANGRPAPELRATATAPVSASHDALGGSPLDPRLTFEAS